MSKQNILNHFASLVTIIDKKSVDMSHIKNKCILKTSIINNYAPLAKFPVIKI